MLEINSYKNEYSIEYEKEHKGVIPEHDGKIPSWQSVDDYGEGLFEWKRRCKQK